MRLEQLAFFASVLVGIEVAMVTLALALAVAHSLTVADVKTLFLPKSQSDTQTPCRGIRTNYGHHS